MRCGTQSNAAWRCECSPRAAEAGIACIATTAARVGCASAMPARLGYPTRGRSLPKQCSLWRAARIRQPRSSKSGAGTFADLAARYLEQHAKRHNKSWQQGDKLIRRHALPRWGKLQATTVTRADVKAMMASIEAPIVANQTLAAVSAIFSWALKEEILPANPCKLVPRGGRNI